MVKNFEKITENLTDNEKRALPLLISGLSRRDQSNLVKGQEIADSFQTMNIKLTQPQIRKLCNLIRCHGILPLIATSQGYYVSYDESEIKNQVQSLKDRARAIDAAAIGLNKFLEEDKDN